jgi:hypothetical protein
MEDWNPGGDIGIEAPPDRPGCLKKPRDTFLPARLTIQGDRARPEGNLVGPDSGVLANVAQLDPVRVVFSVSDRDLLEVQRRFCGSGWITAPTGH